MLTIKQILIMKPLSVFDGFNIILALVCLIMPFAFNYETSLMTSNIVIGISLLSNIFITNKKIKISIAVLCVLAILYAYFQIK
jgi:hypothetical protein